MEHIIRKREYKDIEGIAKVVTLAWQQTYRGIINDDFLDELSENEDDRIKKAQAEFEDDDGYFVVEVDNKVVGFVRVGESSEEYNKVGEVFSLYLIQDFKGYGFGRKLLTLALETLKQRGYKEAVLGCIEKNKSNGFYQHMGGELIGKREIVKGTQTLRENVYRYKL